QGLLDPAVLAHKAEEEKPLRARFKKQAADEADPWQRIADAQKKLAEFERRYQLLETGHAFYSELFGHARDVVRLTAELEKPSARRLREYRDSNLESLKFHLYSPAPIHADLERAKLAGSLTFLAETRGAEPHVVNRVLAGKAPAARAAELVAGTKLFDPAERKRLVEGGFKAVEASQDEMIRLALLIDGEARNLRQRYETEIE